MAAKSHVFNENHRNDPVATDVAIIHALNSHENLATPAKERSWFCEYMIAERTLTKKELEYAKNIDPKNYYRVGRYCRMILDGYPIQEWASPKISAFVETNIRKKLKKPSKKSAVVTNAPTLTIQDKISEKAKTLAATIQNSIDDYILNIKNIKKSDDLTVFDIQSFINVNEIKPMMSARIIPYIVEQKAEWDLAQEQVNDPEVKEAYSIYSNTEVKRIIRFYIEIIQTLEAKGAQKVSRNPRKKKIKSPSEIVKSMQYMAETKDFGGLKSISPEKIIGATKLIIFSTKYRELTILEAENEKIGFGVKGTTIQGFAPERSTSKRIRAKYVDDVLKVVQSQGIRAIRKSFGEIKSKETPANGRINKECIIMKVM